MTPERRIVRCAIYTRKSSDEGLDQAFNSLDAQFEACAAYVASQKHEGWKAISRRYDDGGFSGGTLERPALIRLLADIEAGRIDMVIVYKIDRLTRSLLDFGKLVERLDSANCSFVSVTQSFNTSTSMGRLMLNVLLSFAQFEREVTAERIRDKIAASKKKGIWMGGVPPLGYLAKDRQLLIDEPEAAKVRQVFELYSQHRCVVRTKQAADAAGICSRPTSRYPEGAKFSRGGIYWLLTNPIYVGEIRHKEATYPGLHQAIIARDIWNEVQALLTSHGSGRRRGKANAAAPSLLAGKLIDERGDRLSPSHSGHSTRRHRYYVSRRLIDGSRQSDLDTGWRLPADHLEQLVASFVEQHFRRPGAAFETLVDRGVAGRVADVHARLGLFVETRSPEHLLRQVEQVRLAAGALEIDLCRGRVAELLAARSDEIAPAFLRIAAPFQMRRRGRESRLLLGDDPILIDPALLKFVARGFVWWRAIEGGQSIAGLARAERISDRLVAIHLPAAFLAPDIVERIIDGRQPSTLTVSALRQTKLPLQWDAQREQFGITNRDISTRKIFAAS